MTLNSAEETQCLVRFVCNVFLAAVKDPYTPLETVNQVLLEGGGAEGQEEGVNHYSVKNIKGRTGDCCFQHPIPCNVYCPRSSFCWC